MNNHRINLLYITYDGLNDPLGQSQIIPYLKRLSINGVKIVVISFEKKDSRLSADSFRKINMELKQCNISWNSLRYHQKYPFIATLYDVVCGCVKGMLIMAKYKIDVVHARGYVSAFIASCLKVFSRAKFIFDMRGFWVDEKVDSGFWRKNSLGYKVAKKIEKRMLAFADYIIVLTEKAKVFLLLSIRITKVPIEVIATCVDLKLFRPMTAARNNLPQDKLVVIYLGSIGTFYGFKEAISFFQMLHNIDKRFYFLVLVNNEIRCAENIIKAYNIPADSYKILSLCYKEVSDWLKEADFSLIFYHRNNSYAGCCPTKFGESLACGVPVIISKNIGDCDETIKTERIGFLAEDLLNLSHDKMIEQILLVLNDREDLRNKCRDVAERFFSLDRGTSQYFGVYNRLKIRANRRYQL